MDELHRCINEFRALQYIVIRSYKVHSRPKVRFSESWLNAPGTQGIVKELADVLWVYCNGNGGSTLRVWRPAVWQAKFRKSRDYLLDPAIVVAAFSMAGFRLLGDGQRACYMNRSRRMVLR
ncbi:MAG: hypothetical protein AB1609_14115 [Bacillota bacterium]